MAGKNEWQKGYSSLSFKRLGTGGFYECKCKFCGGNFTGQPKRLTDHLLHETAYTGMNIRGCDHKLTERDPDLEDDRQELLAKLRKQREGKKQPPSQMQTGTSGASGSGSSIEHQCVELRESFPTHFSWL